MNKKYVKELFENLQFQSPIDVNLNHLHIEGAESGENVVFKQDTVAVVAELEAIGSKKEGEELDDQFLPFVLEKTVVVKISELEAVFQECHIDKDRIEKVSFLDCAANSFDWLVAELQLFDERLEDL